jgi:predicted ATP-grasp superfamily ATP-dependent carboligase
VNLLVTSSRMPFALDEIRKFGRRGHRVFAADTFSTSPGGHSRFVRARMEVAPPTYAPAAFLADVKQIVLARRIDLIIPCFEEVFYLARHGDELSQIVRLFASGLPVLARLHDKAAFNALAREAGVPVPETTLVDSAEDLRAALREYPRYVARPAWSRGGIEVLANAGPLAGMMALDDCHPSHERPWIVQRYVDGSDLCTFSVAQHGRVVLHCTYAHPLEIEHRGGIVFESVDEPEALRRVQQLVEATGYHGQLGVDFRRDGQGLFAVECNPRPTAGVHLADDAEVVDAVLAPPPGPVRVVPAGRRRKYTSAIVRDMLLHWSHLRSDAAYLFSDDAEDVFAAPGDRLPALYQVLCYAHMLAFRVHHRAPAHGTGLMAAYFDGIEWNGGVIP